MRLFACVGIYAGAYVGDYPLTNNFINNDIHPHLDGMQKDNRLESSIDIKRPLVIRALRRSNVRKKIAEYLFEIRSGTGLGCRGTQTCGSSNVGS